MEMFLQHSSDPWWVALAIVLVITTVVTGYAVREMVRDWLVLAMALPPAIFKKVFGDPPQHRHH